MTDETKSELEEWVETLLDACKTYKDYNAFLKQIFTHELVDVFEAGQRSKQLPEFTDEEKIKDFGKWWFVAGGAIHRAEKYEEIGQLARLANTLPRLAWIEGFNYCIEQMKKKTGS